VSSGSGACGPDWAAGDGIGRYPGLQRWRCTDGELEGIRYRDEQHDASHTTGVLAGSFAYEGLLAFRFADAGDDGYTFESVLFPGGMVEWPAIGSGR